MHRADSAVPTRFILGLAPVLALAPLLGGCATLFTGQTDVLRFDANVPGVRLSIDGQYQGELPLELELSRNFVGGRQFLASFERDGYVPQAFPLAREFNTVAVLDVTSPLVSGGIDVLTGSLMRFDPLDYHVHMLAAGDRADGPGFRRSVEVAGFALANHRALQKDLARGGGEHLTGLGALLAGGAGELAGRVEAALLAEAGPLLAAPDAPAFLARLDGLVRARPDLGLAPL